MQAWVEGPIHLRFDLGRGFGQSQVLELLGEGVDLAVELTRPDAGHGLVQAGSLRFGD
jgi:hypothetical protein